MPSHPRFRYSCPAALLAALLTLLPRIAASQCGTAPTGDPGGFGIDGDLDAGTPTAGTSDWMSFMLSNGTPIASTTLHGFDDSGTSDLRLIQSTSRLSGNPNTDWVWGTASGMMTRVDAARMKRAVCQP